jgi:hypothetical protein
MIKEQKQIQRIEDTLKALILWLAQSSTGVLAVSEATKLLDMLNKKKKK